MAGVQSPPPQPYYGVPVGAMSPPQMQLPGQSFSPYPPGSPMPNIRPGTLPPGTAVKIGDYAVVVQRFLSEGGFAHVYLVNSDRPINGLSQHVLKRVAVPDKDTLKEVRWEVDVMKAVRGHKHIVNLIEASASPIPGSTGYEVFILMEYCAGGGIIDMMNTRLQNRLTESEILKIFSDVVEGVCHMHTRDPPLIHRDLKVENILLASSNLYKLCDFGSTTTPSSHPPSTMAEIQALEAELNKHTTLQYRAPEMCDVWSRKGVGLPADIWALGVLLYKLCFYTTPFEEQGPLAILNVQYKMPSFPAYSDMIRRLISGMLVENARNRPTAWQVHEEVSRLRGTQPKTQYKPRQSSVDSLPTSRPNSSLDTVVSDRSQSSSVTKPPLSEIAPGLSNGISPMRRGRPNKGQQDQPSAPSSGLSAEWQLPRAEASSPNQPPLSASLTPTSHAAATVPGFGDSFAPTIPVVQPPSPSTFPQNMTSLAAAQIFEDLAAPDGGKSRKAQPTLASMAAAKSGNGAGSVQAQGQSYPPALAPRPAQSNAYGGSGGSSGSSGPAQVQPPIGGSNVGLRRVTPTKPLGPRPAPQAGSNNFPSSSASAKPVAKPKPASFSQAKAKSMEGEQLPVPAEGSRPDLISRASQTSPSLMSEWKRKSLDEKEKAERESRTRSSEVGKEGEPARFPGIDEWESTGFSPPPAVSRQSSQSAVPRPAVLDLLGDDDDGMGSAPTPTISKAGPSPTPPAPLDIPASRTSLSSAGLSSYGSKQSATSPSTGSNFLSASPPKMSQSPANLRPSPSPSAVALSSFIESDSTPPALSEEQSPREKFRPVKRDSPIVSRTSSLIPSASSTRKSFAEGDEADSSDDNEGPEQLEDEGNVTSPSNRPPVASRNGSYGAISAGSSVKTVNPQVNGTRPPPILAPKPQRAGINSIVSRYETLSTGPRSSKVEEPSSPVLNRKPSQNAPTKPRGVSISDTAEDFASRYPALDSATEATDSRPVPPVAAGSPVVVPLTKKEPFKPSRENSSTSLSGLAAGGVGTPRARPQSMHFPTPPPSDPSDKPRLTKASFVSRTSAITPKHANGSPEEDKDTPFAGVASLRDRWEKKVSAPASTSQSSTLGRRASTAYR